MGNTETVFCTCFSPDGQANDELIINTEKRNSKRRRHHKISANTTPTETHQMQMYFDIDNDADDENDSKSATSISTASSSNTTSSSNSNRNSIFEEPQIVLKSIKTVSLPKREFPLPIYSYNSSNKIPSPSVFAAEDIFYKQQLHKNISSSSIIVKTKMIEELKQNMSQNVINEEQHPITDFIPLENIPVVKNKVSDDDDGQLKDELLSAHLNPGDEIFVMDDANHRHQDSAFDIDEYNETHVALIDSDDDDEAESEFLEHPFFVTSNSEREDQNPGYIMDRTISVQSYGTQDVLRDAYDIEFEKQSEK